eukprot:INCI10199.1.p2 GENE.INCI10199.1~~INCI10199.1.p2  ORF type:complete len:304 (-),score=43.16 INCI10199.1:1374-2285(-)
MRVEALVFFVTAVITAATPGNEIWDEGGSVGDVWVSPASTRVPQNASKPTNTTGGEWDFSAAHFDAARGEREDVLVNIRLPAAAALSLVSVSASAFSNFGVTVAVGGARNESVPSISLGRIVALPCAQSAFYSLPGGLFPDAVIEAGSGLQFNATGNMTHSILVEAIVPSATPEGNYSTQLRVSIDGRGAFDETNSKAGHRQSNFAQYFTVPINLRVWPVEVASVLNATMPTIFNFPFDGNMDGATDVGAYYGHPGTLSNATVSSWFSSLCTCRVPPDLPYTATLRSLQDLDRVADPQAEAFG